MAVWDLFSRFSNCFQERNIVEMQFQPSHPDTMINQPPPEGERLAQEWHPALGKWRWRVLLIVCHNPQAEISTFTIVFRHTAMDVCEVLISFKYRP